MTSNTDDAKAMRAYRAEAARLGVAALDDFDERIAIMAEHVVGEIPEQVSRLALERVRAAHGGKNGKA